MATFIDEPRSVRDEDRLDLSAICGWLAQDHLLYRIDDFLCFY